MVDEGLGVFRNLRGEGGGRGGGGVVGLCGFEA